MLNDSLQFGRLTIPNRVVFQPMEGCDCETDGESGGLTAEAVFVLKVCDEVFEDCNDGGECGKRHEDEEEGSPKASKAHVVECVWQGDEEQSGALCRIYAVAFADGKDDESGAKCNCGV